MIPTNAQCKNCFHFQVCADVLKQQLFVKEVLGEENPECKNYISSVGVVKKSEIVEEIFGELLKISTAEGAYDYVSSWDIAELRKKYRGKEEKKNDTQK